MAVNIGPKIGIDGEAEFRKNLNSISQQLKTLGTEMKAVTSAFDANDKSQENLANQSQVLTEQLSLQEKRIAEIQKALDHARSNYAENSNQVQRWQQAMNNAVAELNKTRSQLSKVQSEMDGTEDSTKDLTDALNDVGGASEKASGGLSSMTVAMGNLISSGIQAAASAVADLVSSLWNLDESTEEYRRAQGRLNTAFEAAGYGADTAQQAYKAFYGILGDTDTATEASQLLAQLAESEEDVATWTEIAAGVSGTFGDSLPIEGLIEAANETAKVGQVTGTLADALNWVGINEEQFNAQLAECSTESERNKLIMETLSNQYDQAAQAFYRNNEALVASRNAQAGLDESLSKIGAAVSTVKNELLTAFAPAIETASDAIASFIEKMDIEAAINTAMAFLSNLKDRFVDIFGYLKSALSPLGEALGGMFATLSGIFSPFIKDMQTFIQTGESSSGVFSALSSSIEVLVSILSTVITWMSQFIEWITSGSTSAEVFKSVLVGVGAAFATWQIIQTISTLISTLTTIVAAAKTAFAALNAVLAANPIGIVITAISGLVAAFIYLWNNCEEFRQFWIDLWNGIKEGIASASEWIDQKLDEISQWFSDAWEGIKNLFSDWKDFFTGLWDKIKAIFSPSNIWDFFTNIGKNIVDGIKNGISNAWNGLKNWFNGLIDGLIGGVKSLLGINSPSKVFADMGENMALGLGQGFSGEMRGVQRQIDRSMSGLVAPTMTYGVTAASATSPSGDSIGASVGAAVRAALDGAAVYLNGRKVGNLITQQQNQTAIARGQSPVYI